METRDAPAVGRSLSGARLARQGVRTTSRTASSEGWSSGSDDPLHCTSGWCTSMEPGANLCGSSFRTPGPRLAAAARLGFADVRCPCSRVHIAHVRARAADGAAEPLLDGTAAAVVLEHRGARRNPSIAPFGQRNDRRLEIETLRREYVFPMLGIRGRRPGGHDSRLDEALEAIRKDVGSQSQAALKVGEPGSPAKERIAEDQQAPPLAHDLKRSRCRTLLVFVEPSEHVADFITCMMQAVILA
jgi:hypothetical protein